jgi:hypothetical protein
MAASRLPHRTPSTPRLEEPRLMGPTLRPSTAPDPSTPRLEEPQRLVEQQRLEAQRLVGPTLHLPTAPA